MLVSTGARLHARGAVLNGFDDVVIARAAADIALKLVAHSGFVELLALAIYKIDGGHDHARRAEATLQTMVLAERFLHRMKRAVLGQALDGDDVRAFTSDRQRRAGFDRLAVQVHNAGAALACIAADMGPREA